MKPLKIIAFFFLIFSVQAGQARMIVGTTNFYPPFETQASNNSFFGFDITVMQMICQEINQTCEFKGYPFDLLMKAVSTGEVDLAIAAITINEKRTKLMSLTIPYLQSYGRLIGNANIKTPKGLNTDKSIREFLMKKSIGVQSNTVYESYISHIKDQTTALNVYEKFSTLIEDLMNGKIDTAYVDSPSASYWVSYSNNNLKLIGPKHDFGLGYGIAISPKNINLINQLNQAIVKVEKTEKFKQLYSVYFEWGKN